MENQEKSETSFVPRKNLVPNQYKWDYFFIAIPLIFIILFPSGVIFYLSGRLNLHLVGIYFLSLFGILGTFFIFFLVNIVRIFRKNTLKKRLLILFEICMPLLFVLSFFFFHIIWDSKDPFLCGYRDHIKNKIDLEKTQSWLKTISEEYFTADQGWTNLENIPDEECPEYLKKRLNSVYRPLQRDEFGNPIIIEIIGGGFFHWGYVIGLPDLIYSEDQINEKRKYDEGLLLVQPGFYVWSQG